MQIRAVSTFSGLAVSPHTMRMCSCSACTGASGPAPAPWGRTGRDDDGRDADGVRRNGDGDSYTPASGRTLSREDEAKVRELKARDAEVLAHENAHKAAAGGLARGGPNYEYQAGPDGKRYAVGGDVQIDTSPGRTPAETIAKAQRIRTAGLAPTQPSGQDRSVVAQAAQMESSARAELAEDDGDERADGPTRGSGRGDHAPDHGLARREGIDLIA